MYKYSFTSSIVWDRINAKKLAPPDTEMYLAAASVHWWDCNQAGIKNRLPYNVSAKQSGIAQKHLW